MEWFCFILCHSTGMFVKHAAVGLAFITWASRCFLSVQAWSALTPRLLYMLRPLHIVLVSLMRPVSPVLSHLLLILGFSVYSDSSYPSHVACSPGSQISGYIIVTQVALELFAESHPWVYFRSVSNRTPGDVAVWGWLLRVWINTWHWNCLCVWLRVVLMFFFYGLDGWGGVSLSAGMQLSLFYRTSL